MRSFNVSLSKLDRIIEKRKDIEGLNIINKLDYIWIYKVYIYYQCSDIYVYMFLHSAFVSGMFIDHWLN